MTKQPDKKSMPATSASPAVVADAPPMPWVDAVPSRVPDGEALHLVRLSAVVRWLMASKRLPFVMAVDELHRALVGIDGLRLYLCGSNGAARAVDGQCVFDLSSYVIRPGQSLGRHLQRYWTPLPEGVTPGQSAALFYVEKVWGDGRTPESAMDREDLQASALAMPCQQAAAQWGAGLVAVAGPAFALSDAFKRLCKERKEGVGEAWTYDQRKVLWLEEFNLRQAHGRNGLREFLAQCLGLKNAQAVSAQIAAFKEPKKQKNERWAAS